MKLIEFKEQTVVIAKDQPQYLPMPAYAYKDDPSGRIVCCWKLSLMERIRLLFRGTIWQQMLTFRQKIQPQKITVEKPDMP